MTPPDSHPLKVLLVEDDSDDRMMMEASIGPTARGITPPRVPDEEVTVV